MLYTIEQLITEREAAIWGAKSANEGATEAERASKDARRRLFQAHKNGVEITAEEKARYEELEASADEAQGLADSLALYSKAVSEILAGAVADELKRLWASDAFREKWDGTPFRYKRFNAAAFACLDQEHFKGYAYGSGRVCVRYCPEGVGVWEGSFEVADFIASGFYTGGWDDVLFSVGDGVTAPEPRDLPELAEIAQACRNAATVRAERRRILDDAKREADDLAKSASLGIYAIKDAITD